MLKDKKSFQFTHVEERTDIWVLNLDKNVKEPDFIKIP